MANASQLRAALPGYFNVAMVKALPRNNAFTIARADTEKVGEGAQAVEKPVLRFREGVNALVLSKGRADALFALFGDADLVGRQIRLMVETVKGKEQIAVVSPE